MGGVGGEWNQSTYLNSKDSPQKEELEFLTYDSGHYYFFYFMFLNAFMLIEFLIKLNSACLILVSS